MASMNKSHTSHPHIVVGLPNIQDHIRMVNRLSATTADPELGRWGDLGNLLCELYSQLQHQKQVTVYRVGNRSCSTDDAARKLRRRCRRLATTVPRLDDVGGDYMKTIAAQDTTDRHVQSGRPPGVLERTKENQNAIRRSMKFWQDHNKYGLSIGRGLSAAELIDKVAGETGASKTHIRHALKQKEAQA